MKLDKSSMLLYAVTDRAWLNGRTLAEDVEEVLKAGATFIQLREKNSTYEETLELAKEIKALTDKFNVPFVIDDNVEIAKAIDADGVHIGQSDTEAERARQILGEDKIVGVSAGNLKEALEAEKNGADYIGIGAMFPTDTKKDHTNITFEQAKEICEAVNIPVVAIGGINKDNILKLKGTGIDGVAVISAIFAQNDRFNATRELLELSKEVVQ
ncbi:thiamine phosphate synthase [Lachnospiraceae bacterium NSJ-143]|nr:thiamine phosphate synthase [Lachnospiraceae bacterium NSJ-143]